jgi:hypothetical protein
MTDFFIDLVNEFRFSIKIEIAQKIKYFKFSYILLGALVAGSKDFKTKTIIRP